MAGTFSNYIENGVINHFLKGGTARGIASYTTINSIPVTKIITVNVPSSKPTITKSP